MLLCFLPRFEDTEACWLAPGKGSVVTGAESDPIRRDAECFAQRLDSSTAGTRFIQAEGMPHGFMKWVDSSQAVRTLARASHRAFGELLER